MKLGWMNENREMTGYLFLFFLFNGLIQTSCENRHSYHLDDILVYKYFTKCNGTVNKQRLQQKRNNYKKKNE